MSASVVVWSSDRRNDPWATRRSTPIAASTWMGPAHRWSTTRLPTPAGRRHRAGTAALRPRHRRARHERCRQRPVRHHRARWASRPHRADHGGPPRGDLGVRRGARHRRRERQPWPWQPPQRPPPRRRRACPLVDRAPGLPEDLRIEFDPVTNEERTGSDRPAELVTRDRDQVGILDMGGKVDPPQRLDGIGVKPRAGSVTSGDLDQRWDVVHHPVSLLMAMIDTTETGWPAASRTAASRSGETVPSASSSTVRPPACSTGSSTA